MTGENMVWEQQVVISRAVLQRNASMAARVFQLMWSHINITTGDGVQADGSFHFHGAILYSGGYGADFALQLATYVNLAAGTMFAVTDAAMSVLDTYLLDGQQYFMRGPPSGASHAARAQGSASKLPPFFYDISTKGREIVRPPDGNLAVPSQVFAAAFNSTAFLGSKRGSEYRGFLDRLGGREGAGAFKGTRHFYRSDYTAHHTGKFAFTLKMYSTRMYNNEITNGEGLESWHTADGALYT